MQIFSGNIDSISRPGSSELIGNRVSNISLPHNEIIYSSQFSHSMLTNNGQSGGAKGSGDCVSAINKDDGVEKDDLKLQKATEEMRRLDEILKVKTFQGQEAKRQRKELRDRLWQELLQDAPKGRSECAYEASNTRSFLALEAATPQVQEEESDFDPVFETEAPECANARCHSTPGINSKNTTELFQTNLLETKKQDPVQENQSDTSEIKRKHKNFVKRNIELIDGEGGQEVLTQTEKERLDKLLQENDQEEEDCAKEADGETNVWAVSVLCGQGYTPEPPDLKYLHDIDSKIRRLLPVEEFTSLQASFSNLSEFQGRGSEAGWRSDGDPLPGEKALKDMREWRGQERRLQEIQQQLQTLSHGQDDEGPDLTEEQLLSLLEECELAETWARDMEVNDLTPR